MITWPEDCDEVPHELFEANVVRDANIFSVCKHPLSGAGLLLEETRQDK